MIESERRATLKSAGVPDSIVSEWDAETHRLLCIAYAPSNQHVADLLATEIRELAGVAAIFEQNGEALVGYLPNSNEFIRFYYEDGLEGATAISVLGIGYQQFAASILLEYVESALMDECLPLSSTLEFESATEFMDILHAERYDRDAMKAFHAALAET